MPRHCPSLLPQKDFPPKEIISSKPVGTVSSHSEFQFLGHWTRSIRGLAVWQASQFTTPACQGKERHDSLLAHSIPLQGRKKKKKKKPQTLLAVLTLEGKELIFTYTIQLTLAQSTEGNSRVTFAPNPSMEL